jgi:hypothetical protein
MWAADAHRSVVLTGEVAFEAGCGDCASKDDDVGTHATMPVTSASSAPVYASAGADADAEEPQCLLNLSLLGAVALEKVSEQRVYLIPSLYPAYTQLIARYQLAMSP